jgi:hypothetical protein
VLSCSSVLASPRDAHRFCASSLSVLDFLNVDAGLLFSMAFTNICPDSRMLWSDMQLCDTVIGLCGDKRRLARPLTDDGANL